MQIPELTLCQVSHFIIQMPKLTLRCIAVEDVIDTAFDAALSCPSWSAELVLAKII